VPTALGPQEGQRGPGDGPALRIATWHRLEAGRRVASIQESNRAKIHTLAQAQGDGRLGKDFSPAEILGIVLHLAALWDSGVPEWRPCDESWPDREPKERRTSAPAPRCVTFGVP